MSDTFSGDLATYIKAGYPIVNLVSGEEDRAVDLVQSTLERHDLGATRLFVWSITRGLVDLDGRPADRGDTREPLKALAFCAGFQEPAVFLFKDFHPWVEERNKDSALVVRAMRDLVPVLKGRPLTVVWLSPVLAIPPELAKDVTVVDLPLPSEADYRAVLDDFVDQVKDNPRVLLDLDEDGADRLVKACRGLSLSEAEGALARTIVSRQRLDGDDVGAILAEKEQIIRKSGILEFTASPEQFGTVGGLGSLKAWLRRRNQAFTQKARDFGLPNPRGVLLVGVPGCGKSLCAKAVAAEWRKPLLKFDLGRVFGSLVGDSERNMRQALKTAEGVAPAVLWIDEIEKGLAGVGGSGDSGVTSRVFGTMLVWMEEKRAPVFVVATANDVTRLPPEFLRKGRFDEIFFVDLPSEAERAEILMIHLGRRGRDPNDFNLGEVVRRTPDFNGAELEEVVVEGLFRAFDEKGEQRHLQTRHLLAAAGAIVPLARSRAADIERMRAWAQANARPAAAAPEAIEEAPDDSLRRRRRMIDA